MVSLRIARHSRSTDTDNGIFASAKRNAPLSRNGVDLAIQEAWQIQAPPDAIYTSRLRRAAQTAAIDAVVMKDKFGKAVPVIIVANLESQNMGSLEGLPIDSSKIRELDAKPGGLLCLETSCYGGEQRDRAVTRQLLGFQRIVASAGREGFKDVLVVTHSDVISRFMNLMGQDTNWRDLRYCRPSQAFSGGEITHNLAQVLPVLRNRSVTGRTPFLKD